MRPSSGSVASGGVSALGPGGGAPEVPVPLSESVASVVFVAAVVLVSSGRRALSDMRADYLDALRLTAEEQSMADRAMLQGNLSRKKRQKRIDSLAAQLMLQNYLDAKGRNQ